MAVKIIVDFESNTRTIYASDGSYVGVIIKGIFVDKLNDIPTSTLECITEDVKPFTTSETIVELVKLGLTPDELVKLKHNELL